MGKILWGVFCLVIVFGVVLVSARADNARNLAYDTCLDTFNSENMPYEIRESFLRACMQ